MKKTNRTRLTAMMFAAAGIGGCMLTLNDAEILYRIPAEAAGKGCTTTMTTAAAARLSAENAAQAEAICGAPGDVNIDGVINTLDIVALQKFLLGKESNINADSADLDGDGTIDIFDMGLLKRDVIQQEKYPEPVTETTMQPVYGPPHMFTSTTDATTTTMAPPETTMETLYGPPVWMTTTLEIMTSTEPQDVYGPPNWFTREPTEPPTVTTTTEILPQPEYGPPDVER